MCLQRSVTAPALEVTNQHGSQHRGGKSDACVSKASLISQNFTESLQARKPEQCFAANSVCQCAPCKINIPKLRAPNCLHESLEH